MPAFTVSLEVMAIDHEAAAAAAILLMRDASQLPLVTVTGEGATQIIDLETFSREQMEIDYRAQAAIDAAVTS